MSHEERTDTCIENVGLDGLCPLMETHQWFRNSASLFYTSNKLKRQVYGMNKDAGY